MFSALLVVGVAALCLLIAIWIRRTRKQQEIDQHSITPEALHTLLASNKDVSLYDVRRPLDLLAHSEIIPGAQRLPPQEFREKSAGLSKEKDYVLYCTCPGDETSLKVLHEAGALGFDRIKVLKGGLAAWKAKGYPVEPYTQSFHLEIAT
jgi:rhodanese-related sulfurtransferase